MKNTLLQHKHEVGDDTFGMYHTSRGIKNPDIEPRVDSMVTTGTKRSKFYDFLLERGEDVIKHDIDNIINAHRSSASTKVDDDATAKAIAKFATENEGSIITVDETDKGETGVISLTTRHMRELFSRFPELLLVGCTRKTNR